MKKQEIIEILNDWNYWNKELESGFNREKYLKKCESYLKSNVVVSLIGLRRSGKSFIMRQMIKKLISEGVEKKNILMINFEDRRLIEFYPKMIDEIYETYLEILKPDKQLFIFLDEIHNVPNWERWVRTMHELGNAKIIISGSSSKLLAGELASILTGRHLDIMVYPLNFKEFLDFKKIKIESELDIAAKKIEINSAFNEYMEWGGFPEVVLSNEKKQLLLSYFDDVITKDVQKRYKIRKSEKLFALARFYLTNISNPITFNSLNKFIETSVPTTEKFSSYLEEANLLFFIKRFSYKVKEQEKSYRKVYALDIGLFNSIGFRFTQNLGKIAENLAAIKLLKNPYENREVYYWNDGKGEVDFIIKENLEIKQLIQVCYDIGDYKTKERELSSLFRASTDIKCKNLLIVTENKDEEEIINGKKVIYKSLWRWLLEDTENLIN